MKMNSDLPPLISVIIPVYKVERYLKRCVDSVLNQTYTNLEIILVDDGSPDLCPKICDDYATLDSRVKVVHKENGGLSSARNAGLDICKGEYIAFVDSDDLVSKYFIEFLYQAVVKKNVNVSIAEYRSFKQDEVLCDKNWPDNYAVEKQSLEEILSRYSSIYSHDSMLTIVSWNKLYKANLFDNIRFPEGKLYEDAATTYKILNQCDEVALIKNPLYYYLLRHDSISGNEKFTERTLDFFDALKGANDFFLEQKKERFASFIIPQLIKAGLYSWWGTKYILKQSKRAEEILQYIKLKSQKITATQYFYGLQKYCILLLLKFPVLYAIYRRLVPGLIGNRR
jgi:glycosyltransferase involved in cell wall biosynthesis